MWPWSGSDKYVKFKWASTFRTARVHFEGANNAIMRVRVMFEDFFLLPSRDGRFGESDSYHVWYPHSGWTNAELRELGFFVPDDGIAPQEVQLARAVLSGDKAAAGALADWVTENWNKETK